MVPQTVVWPWYLYDKTNSNRTSKRFNEIKKTFYFLKGVRMLAITAVDSRAFKAMFVFVYMLHVNTVNIHCWTAEKQQLGKYVFPDTPNMDNNKSILWSDPFSLSNMTVCEMYRIYGVFLWTLQWVIVDSVFLTFLNYCALAFRFFLTYFKRVQAFHKWVHHDRFEKTDV